MNLYNRILDIKGVDGEKEAWKAYKATGEENDKDAEVNVGHPTIWHNTPGFTPQNHPTIIQMAEEAISIANDTNAGAYSDSRGLPGIRKEGRCTAARMMIFLYGALLREWPSELYENDEVRLRLKLKSGFSC